MTKTNQNSSPSWSIRSQTITSSPINLRTLEAMQRGTVYSSDFLVTATPAAAYYIQDFITVEEEEYLLRKASLTQ